MTEEEQNQMTELIKALEERNQETKVLLEILNNPIAGRWAKSQAAQQLMDYLHELDDTKEGLLKGIKRALDLHMNMHWNDIITIK